MHDHLRNPYVICVLHVMMIVTLIFMVSMMSNVPLAVRVYWNSLRGVLADASTDTSLPRLRECLQKHVPVPAVSRCLWCLM